MGLLLTSDHYMDTLFKILKELKVPKGIAANKLGHVVNVVFTIDQISFSLEELADEGDQHMKHLFIMVRCNEKLVSRVVIDNGSLLIICSPLL